MDKRIKLYAVGPLLLAASFLVGLIAWIAANEYFLRTTMVTKEIQIAKGASFSSLYKEITEGMNVPPGFKEYLLRVKKLGKNLKYGYYAANGITLNDFLKNIKTGAQSLVKVTVPEGFNIFEIASVLERLGIADKNDFLGKCFDPETTREITGETRESVEGFLAPGTYKFPKNYDPVLIMKTMRKEFSRTLPPDFAAKAAERGLTPYEAVILASIVQKETYSAEESPLVASVFLNRLRLKMRLQADPTIIYGKYLDYTGNISKKDIQDSSNIFNTYRHGGLPPTPICNPSVTALNAVINPADTDYIYFVADREGKHIFSSDYRDHVNNVNKYQKNR